MHQKWRQNLFYHSSIPNATSFNHRRLSMSFPLSILIRRHLSLSPSLPCHLPRSASTTAGAREREREQDIHSRWTRRAPSLSPLGRLNLCLYASGFCPGVTHSPPSPSFVMLCVCGWSFSYRASQRKFS